MNWGLTSDTLMKLNEQGVVRVSKGNENQPYVFRYLSANYVQKIKSGRWAIQGIREDNTKIIVETGGKITRATTVWQNKLYDAGPVSYTHLTNTAIGNKAFAFLFSIS